MPPTQNTMSIWSLVAEASLLVQAVMLILVVASIISWVMIFQRAFYLRKASAALTAFERQFWSGIDLNHLYRQGNGRTAEGVENIFRAGFKELDRKSTRLNSSHVAISYAVFCLK